MRNKVGKHFILVFSLGAMVMAAAYARLPRFSARQLRKPPPKIIRTCCQFGSDVSMVGIPFRKVSAVTAPPLLGAHVYLGSKSEKNGIIYTHTGGFIDVGHLRDQADWTAFLYYHLRSNRDASYYILHLGREGADKKLIFYPSPELTDRDLLNIAGHIAFDLSMWHEISTWFGISYVPLIPERYSSFSPEDIYSNALGVLLGQRAIQSNDNYEEAMTEIIDSTLIALDAVPDIEQTKAAMNQVEGIWWSRKEKLPKGSFLIKRYYDAYRPLRPWLIPEDVDREPTVIRLEEFTERGKLLTDYYSLQFHTGYRIPVKRIFPDRQNKLLTNLDFPQVVQWIHKDVDKG